MVPAPEGLDHGPGRHEVQPQAAVLLGHGDAEEACLGDLAEGFRRPPFLRIHAGGQRVQLAAGEGVCGFEDTLLLGVEPVGVAHGDVGDVVVMHA